MDNRLIAGTNDGMIYFITQNMTVENEINLSRYTSFPAGIRSLDWNSENHTVLVGTRGAEIFEVPAENPEKSKCLM